MNVIDLALLRSSPDGAARFEGSIYGASMSLFVVTSAPGTGAAKHRHPYEEVFVILDGDIEVVVNGETHLISSGNIVIIPPHAWHEFKNRSMQAARMMLSQRIGCTCGHLAMAEIFGG